MPSTPWFPRARIARACPTRRLSAGSAKLAELSSTLPSCGLSSPSRRRKCPLSLPPPARRFPQPCRTLTQPLLAWGGVEPSVYLTGFSMVFPLFFAPIFTLTRWDEPDWPSQDWPPCDLPPRVLAALVSPEIVGRKGLA